MRLLGKTYDEGEEKEREMKKEKQSPYFTNESQWIFGRPEENNLLSNLDGRRVR